VLDELSRALEHTAQLAEEHAARSFRQLDAAAQQIELERAHRARTYAERARFNADRLRSQTGAGFTHRRSAPRPRSGP
jgi:hypothetical protein